jgi:hypothetical protein
MLKKGYGGTTCGLVVHRLCNRFGKAAFFSTQSTNLAKYLTSQVFLMRVFYTAYNRVVCGFKQAFLANFNLLNSNLCPVSTGPITNTNLIKEL